MPRIEPGAATCEGRTLPLCYSVPPEKLLFRHGGQELHCEMFSAVLNGKKQEPNDKTALTRRKEAMIPTSQ